MDRQAREWGAELVTRSETEKGGVEVITRIVSEDFEERLFRAAQESTAEFEQVLQQCASSAGLDTRLSLLGDGETRIVENLAGDADDRAALVRLHETALSVGNELHLGQLTIALRALGT